MAVLTFGGINLICFPSTVATFPTPLTIIGLESVVVVPDIVDGIVIFIGCGRYGELMLILGTSFATVALEVVATFFCSSARIAAFSRSLPPPK